MKRWRWRIGVVGGMLLLAACAEPREQPPPDRDNERASQQALPSTIPDPAEVGQCALEPKSGALIGEILGIGVDPATEQPAYRVRLETAPEDTAYVGAGVRTVSCEQARAEQE